MALVTPTGSVDRIELLAQLGGTTAPVTREPNAEPQHPDTRSDISAAAQLYGALAALGDAVDVLARPSTWQATASRSQDSRAVQAAGSSARPGSYQVQVDALAQAQATASPVFSSLSTVIGLGTLHIEMGTWNASQTAFATNPNWPKASVNFGPKDHTLEQVRDRINASGAGVVATVVSDATGSRLVLRATNTGQANGFKLRAEPAAPSGDDPRDTNDTASPASPLEVLAFDPSVASQLPGMRLLQPAQDTSVRVNGRPLRSPDPTLDDPDSGLRLQAKALTQGPGVRVDVVPDPSEAAQAIVGVAQRYNALRQQTGAQGDPGGQAATRAAPDSPERVSAQAVVRTVEALFSPRTPGNPATALAAIGLSLNPDGLMQVDAARLTQALTARPERVRALLTGDDAQGQIGLSQRLLDTLSGVMPAPTEASVGPAATSAAGMQFRQRLLAQYLDAAPGGADLIRVSPARSDGVLLTENAA